MSFLECVSSQMWLPRTTSLPNPAQAEVHLRFRMFLEELHFSPHRALLEAGVGVPCQVPACFGRILKLACVPFLEPQGQGGGVLDGSHPLDVQRAEGTVLIS